MTNDVAELVVRAARALVRADAAPLPSKSADGALTEILPPFGVNPPQMPASKVNAGNLAGRTIHNDPRELWYLALPQKMTPKQVAQILRSALGGDIWQQWQLLSLMMDTWPMFRKCAHELSQSVSRCKFKVHPYVQEEGSEPTSKAKEKADLVARALRSMRPDPTTDEKGFRGTVYDLTEAMLNGLMVTEVMWWMKDLEIMPRATAWVHPRHFTFTNDGKLALFDDSYQRLNYAVTKPGQTPDLRGYLFAQYSSKSGSSLGAGLMRPLAWYWAAVMFNRDWMLSFAQKFGNPFLVAKYPNGSTEDEVDAMEGFLAEAGSQGWTLVKEGSEVTMTAPPAMSGDNAQRVLMQTADEAVQYLLLGQTGTTQGTAGKLGNDTVRADVKSGNVEGLADFVAEVLTEQLAQNILLLNYGEDSERPTVEPDFAGEVDPSEQATRDLAIIAAGVPITAEDFYKRNSLTMPEPGDQVIVGGKLGIMGDTSQELGGEPEQPLGPDGLPLQEQADDFEQADAEEVGARSGRALTVRASLALATDEELEHVTVLAQKAKQAKHRNGEHSELSAYLSKLRNKKGESRYV